MNLHSFLQNPLDSIALLPPGGVLPLDAEARLYDPLSRLVGRKAASKVLTAVGAEGVRRLSAVEIASAAEVSDVLAHRVVAARELHRASTDDAPAVASCPSELRGVLPTWLRTIDTEVVLAVALTLRHRVKAVVLVAKGGGSVAAFAPRDVLTPLVRVAAAAFVLVHCHPSGDPSPSEEDLRMTNRLAFAGETLGVPLLDHLIVGGNATASFSELGLLPDCEEREALSRAAEARSTP